MNFAGIIGKNQELSRHELASAGATITHQSGLVVFFQKEDSDTHRAGLTKRGKVVSSREVDEIILKNQPKIIGSNNKDFAMNLKRNHTFIKRVKIIEPHKTDYDIKTKGLEILTIPNDEYIIIDHYQNIPLYEAIDIEKPISGMTIGMMPSKLAHLLLKIAVNTHRSLSSSESLESLTIRDPFAGFGTTNMIANALGYDTIGSDLNITQAKKNIARRETTSDHTEHKITLRKHDVTKPFGPLFSHADIIVSEGRLGPIVSGKTQPNTLRHHSQKVADLYTAFFHNIQKMGPDSPSTIVITIPEYDRFDYEQPRDLLQKQNIPGLFTLPEVYRRKHQRVGRRILIRTKS